MSTDSTAARRSTRRLAAYLPIVDWLPKYQRSWLKTDLIAGVSVWALMVPTSLGYATISGVPVQYGLYAAAFGLIAFALFSTSKQVTQGPSSSTAAVLGAAVLSFAAAGSAEAVSMAAAIVFVAGLLFIVMWLFRMGWISNFLSAAVLTGFTFGVGINVAVGELFKITGTERSGDNTWQKLWAWFSTLPDTNRTTLVVGALALALVFGVGLLAPRVPGALLAVVLGIAASVVLDLEGRGVALIGEVPSGLPSLALPDLALIWDNIDTVLSGAVGLLLVGFSVTTAAVREYATKHNYQIDIDQELLAQGVSNMSSGLVQGIFDNGSLSKSPINDAAGAKSQVSNLAQAVMIILTMVFLAPFFSDLPDAVLGAIIIEAVTMGMMNVPEMRRILRVKRIEFLAAAAALLGVLTFGIIQGVFIGVGISMVWLVAVSALPNIPELGRKPDSDTFFDLTQHPDGQTYPGLTVMRFDGGIFFANAEVLADFLRELRVRSEQEGHALEGVVLSMEGVNYTDTEGVDVVRKIAEAGRAREIDLHLARVKSQVLDVLRRDGLFEVIPVGQVHADIADAVAYHQARNPAT